jgi:nicotinamidase-related amidase
MRDMDLIVPEDCVAACNEREHRFAMDQIKNMLKADTMPSTELDAEKMARRAPN